MYMLKFTLIWSTQLDNIENVFKKQYKCHLKVKIIFISIIHNEFDIISKIKYEDDGYNDRIKYAWNLWNVI